MWLPTGRLQHNSYLLCEYQQVDHRQPPGFDRTRDSVIGDKNVKLKHIEEAFTTSNWLVRIYRYVVRDIFLHVQAQRTRIAISIFSMNFV